MLTFNLNIIMLHVDMDVDVSKLHVNIIYLECRGQKYVTMIA